MSPVSGKARDLYRMANWLVREQLERMPWHGFNREDIRWGNARQPKRGELTKLRKPFPSGEGITVEWAHTYVTPDGMAMPVRWFEEVRHEWEESLKDAGVKDVRFARVPMVDTEGGARAHQLVHQEAAMSWGPEHPLRRLRLHMALATHLERNPQGLGSHDEVGNVLQERWGIAKVIYEASRTSGRRAAELAEARAKGEAVREVLSRKRGVRDPVFLVNGTYVIATRSVTDAYQVLNQLVRRLREGR